VPTLLEVQQAFRRSLIDRDDADAGEMLARDVPRDRLDIYRNTSATGLTKALQLSYPAVHRLVGNEFFAAAADLFATRHPPRSAWLDEYGGEFPQFLRQFPPAAGLVYLPDVARLEWAVSRAVHAQDREPLDLSELAKLSESERSRVCFVPHPSVSLLRAGFAVDLIWRAVLDGDDAALAKLDPGPAAIHLLVARLPGGVNVTRLSEAEWGFAAALCGGEPLYAALAEADGIEAGILLAGHLTAGHFVGFTMEPPPDEPDAADRAQDIHP
jgi:hypothetical protein